MMDAIREWWELRCKDKCHLKHLSKRSERAGGNTFKKLKLCINFLVWASSLRLSEALWACLSLSVSDCTFRAVWDRALRAELGETFQKISELTQTLNCFKWHLLSNERERLLSPSSALKSLAQTARNVPPETETQKDPESFRELQRASES